MMVRNIPCFLYVLLTVQLSIFISVINQIDAQNFVLQQVYFMLIHVSSTCTHHQEVKIALQSLWYHHTYRCDDTRWNKLIVKQKFCASSCLITEINTEMHGQQNVKKQSSDMFRCYSYTINNLCLLKLQLLK